MARIPDVAPTNASIFTRIVYAIAGREIRKKTGRAEVIEPIRTMAHHPRLLFGIGQMDLGVEAAKSVPDRIKHLAMLQAARMVGCPF